MNRQDTKSAKDAKIDKNSLRAKPSAELDRLAHEVIGAAIEVHRMLGPGLLESVYEEALCVELGLRSLSFGRQPAVDLAYKGHPGSLQRRFNVPRLKDGIKRIVYT